MTRKSSQILLLSASALALAACSGGGGHSVTVAPPAPVARLEDGFGTGFGTDYRALMNSEPVKPATSDIVALSLTTEPTALH